MKIKEVTDKLNISPRAVRFYEEKGLLFPTKQEHNLYRTFTEKDVWRLQTIISLREAGMSLSHIRSALQQIDEHNEEELQYYLELQRSVLLSQWLEIKQVIETTEHMITLLKTEQALPIDHIYELAEASKKLREQRSSWKDKWDFNRQAPNHDEQVSLNSGNYLDYDVALDCIVEWVAPGQGEVGLDIGTGTGNLAGRLINQGITMAGVDQSKEMLRICQRKYPAMETRLGNFLALPYLNGQFDFIVSSFAFHHLAEGQQILALEEMRRVLNPSGRICLADLMVANASLQEESGENHNYPNIEALHAWFESNDYQVRTQQLNPHLHLIYAVPN
jgi:putative AdoMet-dependent methyltransferase